MIEAAPGEWTSGESVWTIAAIEGTLVKLRSQYAKERIINTASWHFVSAEAE